MSVSVRSPGRRAHPLVWACSLVAVLYTVFLVGWVLSLVVLAVGFDHLLALQSAGASERDMVEFLIWMCVVACAVVGLPLPTFCAVGIVWVARGGLERFGIRGTFRGEDGADGGVGR
jgi:hypothetical protein